MSKKIRTFATALVVMVTIASGLLTANAQNSEPSAASISQNANSIIGTWVSRVTITNCQTGAVLANVQALNTFNQGGTMTEAGNSLLRSGGQGSWGRDKGDEYDSVFMFFRFNGDGSYGGYQKVQRSHVLSDDRSTLSTVGTFEVFNAAGNMIATACSSETAIRLVN